MITVGGKTYNQLIKEGKVKSPVTNRYIDVNGQTYKKISKRRIKDIKLI